MTAERPTQVLDTARRNRSSRSRFDLPRAIKTTLRIEQEFEADGHILRREGARLKCLCPFHDEKRPSCNIDPRAGRFRCFGCGAAGTVIDYHAKKIGLSAADSIRQLAGRLTLGSRLRPRRPSKTPGQERVIATRTDNFERGTDSDLRKLSAMRCLSIEALELAQNDEVLWFATIRGKRVWIVTDKSGAAAQARRLDGELWSPRRGSVEPYKAHTLSGSCGSWPIGAPNIGSSSHIALVEGGPDFLAAYHLKWCEERGDVVPVAVLGAGHPIHTNALPFFARRRVRLYPHVDQAGWDGAVIGSEQLMSVGAIVDWYDFAGLRRVDGKEVKDLNDFLLIGYDDWEQTRGEGVLP